MNSEPELGCSGAARSGGQEVPAKQVKSSIEKKCTTHWWWRILPLADQLDVSDELHNIGIEGLVEMMTTRTLEGAIGIWNKRV